MRILVWDFWVRLFAVWKCWNSSFGTLWCEALQCVTTCDHVMWYSLASGSLMWKSFLRTALSLHSQLFLWFRKSGIDLWRILLFALERKESLKHTWNSMYGKPVFLKKRQQDFSPSSDSVSTHDRWECVKCTWIYSICHEWCTSFPDVCVWSHSPEAEGGQKDHHHSPRDQGRRKCGESLMDIHDARKSASNRTHIPHLVYHHPCSALRCECDIFGMLWATRRLWCLTILCAVALHC